MRTFSRLALFSGAALVLAASTTTTAARAEAPQAGLSALSAPLAREAATRIACGAPKVERYYARTLRALDQTRWGSLRDAATDDAVELASDALYAAARSGKATPDVFAAFFSAPRARSECTASERSSARTAISRADGPPRPSDVTRCAAAPFGTLRQDPACLVSMAFKASLEGEHERAVGVMADLIAITAIDRIYDGKHLTPADRVTLLENIAHGLRATALDEEDSAIDEHLADAFRGLDLDQVKPSACKDDEPLARMFSGGSLGSQSAFCAATRPALELDKVPVTVRGPGGERVTHLDAVLHKVHTSRRAREIADAADPLAGEDDAVVTELLCMLPAAAADKPYADCATGRLVAKKPASYKVLVGALAWTVEIAPHKDGATLHVASGDHEPLADVLHSARSVAQLRHDLAATTRDLLLGREPKPEELRELAVAAGRLWALTEDLATEPLGGDDHTELVGLLERLPELAGPRKTPLDCHKPEAAMDKLLCAGAPSGGLRELLSLGEGGDVRAVAIRAATSALRTGDSAACSQTAVSGRLLVAMASQVGSRDGESDESDEHLAGAELSAAAQDVASCASASRVARTDERDGPLGTSFDLLPTPGLRVAYSSGFTNGVGGDGFRVLPTLEWLSVRVRLSARGARAFVGVQGSLLDPLAPITELAMRRGDLAYERQGMGWLEVLRPRVELLFGVPAFGRHVFLSAGASLRGAAPFYGDKTHNPLVATPTDRMVYLTPFHADARARDAFSRFVEVGAGARYVF